MAIFARLWREDVNLCARSMFLNFVETYLPLDAEQQAAFARRRTPEGDTTMEALERTWADQLIEQGLEQGLEQGALQARQETLRRPARLRFGEVPPALEARLPTLDAAQLDTALDRVVQSATIDEFLTAL